MSESNEGTHNTNNYNKVTVLWPQSMKIDFRNTLLMRFGYFPGTQWGRDRPTLFSGPTNFHSTCLNNPVLLCWLCLPETLWWWIRRFSAQRGLVGNIIINIHNMWAQWPENYNCVTVANRLKLLRLYPQKRLLDQQIRRNVTSSNIVMSKDDPRNLVLN